MSDAVLEVRGNATAEEMAVLVALVGRPSAPPAATAYETWRRTRLAAMRRDKSGMTSRNS
jgi:hypothetical protein